MIDRNGKYFVINENQPRAKVLKGKTDRSVDFLEIR
jgi:hypothetical protein